MPLGGTKQRALLAVLLLHANEVVSRDRLIDELWGDDPPETAVPSVQVYVSRLRKLLPAETVVTQAPGYVLRVDPARVDLHRFERLVEERRYREALALWRGPPLAEFAHEPFAQPEIARLEELRLAALEERIELDLADGRHAELVGELERLVSKQPQRERLRGQLMLALYRSGRQAEALEAYQSARRTLVDELGIEPGPPLQRLEKAVLLQDPSLDRARPPTAEPPAPSSVFVGREAELAELVAGFDDAVAGRGRLFLLVGEPGIGKSRLAEELSTHARAHGARVLVGRCWEAGGAPAYWPWVQALRAYVRDSEPAALRSQLGVGAADLAQILPEIRERVPDLPEPPPLDAEAARFRLFDAASEFLRRAAADRPIVLGLDDLHAADTASLLLLQFVVRQLGSARVLLVGTYRDVDPVPDAPLTATLAEVMREPVTRRVALRGFDEAEVARYVELTASQIASAELVGAVHAGTEGNPFFVGEIVRLLSLESVRSPSPAGVRLAIPQSVRDVIARRLAHLSDACNRLLVLASVLGREFSVVALARLAGVDEDEVLEAFDEAMTARLIADVPAAPGRTRFAHGLIRDTLYEDLTPARRVRAHRQAVGALEALYGDEPGQFLGELAHHAVAGNDFETGHRYARLAGDRALALLAYEEASRLYQTALEAHALSAPTDERTHCELLLSLGESEARAGNTAVAKRTFLEAAALARRLGLARELARAAAGYGGRIVWERAGDDDRLVPLLEEALAALPEEEVELRVRLLARLAGALRDDPSRERRAALSSQAVELARAAGSPAALAYALSVRASAIIGPDSVDECLTVATELLELAERIRDEERIVQARCDRCIALLHLGEIGAATAELAAATQLARELGQPAFVWQMVGAEAMLAIALGRLDEAEEVARQALAIGRRAQPRSAAAVYWVQQYSLRDFRGGLDDVFGPISELVAAWPARPVFRCVLACLHARLGRLEESKLILDDLSRNDFSTVPVDQEWLFGMSLLAEACALLDDGGCAEPLYRLLSPWAALNAVDQAEGIRGSVARYVGLLATTLGRSEEAERYFEEALSANERMGLRPWLALTQTDCARMLVARAGRGDAERADELMRAALATYRELGMEPRVGEVPAAS